MKRVFLAFEAPEVMKELAKSYREKHDNGKIMQWNHVDDLHITLVPPWHTDSFQKLEGTFELEYANQLDLHVRFSKLEPGPQQKNPRLIWIKGSPSDDLVTLRDDLYKFHPKLDEPKDESFTPHITIARGRSSKELPSRKMDEKVKLTRLHLYETLPNDKRKDGKTYKLHEIMQ